MGSGDKYNWLAIIHYMRPNDNTLYTTTRTVLATEISNALLEIYNITGHFVKANEWRCCFIKSLEILENVALEEDN